MSDVRFEVTGRVARITLDRPARGNALTRRLVAELERTVERADLDPRVHVLLLSGNGKGFCGGYDLIEYAEGHAAGGEPAQGNGGDGAAGAGPAPPPPRGPPSLRRRPDRRWILM